MLQCEICLAEIRKTAAYVVYRKHAGTQGREYIADNGEMIPADITLCISCFHHDCTLQMA